MPAMSAEQWWGGGGCPHVQFKGHLHVQCWGERERPAYAYTAVRGGMQLGGPWLTLGSSGLDDY